jgi:hypothetical protein
VKEPVERRGGHAAQDEKEFVDRLIGGSAVPAHLGAPPIDAIHPGHGHVLYANMLQVPIIRRSRRGCL